MNKQNIILASSSPRRIEIMKQHGLYPTILPADVDETIPEGAEMEDAVMYLALKKALYIENKILASAHDNPVIFAADTVVYKEKIIGKPRDRQDAYEILWNLRGKTHYVATGVCILQAGIYIRHCFCEITKVFFKNYTEKELNDYLDTPEAYDKAGAYAIQGTFGQYVDHIEGDLDNVIGFPWDRIEKEYNNIFK
ncbi:MAG: septum formation protein Maf [Clostridiales bacterium]|jgi:septum formation protein|nr:septum formation protein Maf [Clostridiales bacterium]